MKKVNILLAMLSTAIMAYADTITFQNGDSLKGKLVSMEEGKVKFNSEVVGEVTVDSAKVKLLKLDTEATFVMTDGSTQNATATITDNSVEFRQ